MKYLSIPAHLIRFWYLESAPLFLRTWKNSLLYLEEDLAIGLMFKLLFVPLFHDASLLGRVLSFCFRSLRIFLGLLAFIVITLFTISLVVTWFLLPILPIILPYLKIGSFSWIVWGILFSGAIIFIHHLVSHPEKKVWQIKSEEDILKCTLVKKEELTLSQLFKKREVKNLLLYLEQQPENFSNLTVGPMGEIFKKSWELGKKLVVPYLNPQHFFVSILMTVPNLEGELLKYQLKIDDFIDVLDFQRKKERQWRMVFVWDEDFQVKHLKGVNRGWLGVTTPFLDSVTEDLTKKASRQALPDFVGRPEVVARVINILSLEKGRNVLIVGEAGSGRNTLVEFLAKLIVTGDAPAALATKRLTRFDLVRLLAGITSEGELAEKLKGIFEDVERSGNIILDVDEIQNLGMGEAGTKLNLFALLLPYLESDQFQFVAVTDEGSYIKILEKNKSLARIFAKVNLPPASVSETMEILTNRAIEYERWKKVKVSAVALKKIAELSERFIHNLVLPDAALQTLEESLVSAENGWITKSVVEKVVQQRSSVPIGEAKAEVKRELLALEEIIHQKMIDQEEAVSAVAKTLRRAATELRDEKRPIGSFLFVGPTGVGKTELAKILNEVYFTGKGNFFRLDMSEYQNSASIERLIGASGEEGLLTEAINLHPFSVILLDELEKADPKILTLFLQVLDDGRLTSGSGKTVDFTNTIIIATSNAASLIIAASLQEGQNLKELENQVKGELLAIFKPELLNRFDEVVLFKPLAVGDLQKIVVLKLSALQGKLKEQGYLVEFPDGLVQKLTEKGYDPTFGARPLRRLIQDTIEARLSVMILEGKLPKGEKFMADDSLLT